MKARHCASISVFVAAMAIASAAAMLAGCVASPSERAAMANPVNYFEIPVTDMPRAMRFYERALLVDFELTEIDGHPMALFPFDRDAPGITGALAHGESYQPGRQGVRVYFTVQDIDATLRRAVEAGGRVLYPKTSIGEHGFVAEFEDSEGNCIAIRTPLP
jgi:predicted enzyme related to lactoylglutathione lyase